MTNKHSLTKNKINKINNIKYAMGNIFAYYQISKNQYFMSIDKIFTRKELEQFFKENIYTLEESEIKINLNDI
jgi:hypothetical protein